MSDIKLGSHVGMAGKEMFLASAKEAVSYGANVFMLYTGAPQNTRRKEISELNIEAGWKYAKEHGIEEIIVHAPYIINLANTIKPETYELAVEFLEKEIIRTAAMGSHIMVLHPGSHVNAGVEAGTAHLLLYNLFFITSSRFITVNIFSPRFTDCKSSCKDLCANMFNSSNGAT